MGRPTILLVEDEPAVRELLADVLRDAGYDVVEAADGVQAIRTLEQRDPPAGGLSLVVLDIVLPGMNGLGVLGQLRTLEVGPPVVAISASRHLLSAAVDVGARAVLWKPFDLYELLRVVAGHCLPCEPGAATSATSGTA